MKKLLFIFLFINSFVFSQMPNIAKIWLNNGNPYIGTIGKEEDKEVLKMNFSISEQDKKTTKNILFPELQRYRILFLILKEN